MNLFSIFDDLFHLAFDIAFFSIGIWMLVYVIKTNQRQHIKWIAPGVASDVISLLFRFIEIGHHALGTRWTPQNYISIGVLVDFETVIGMVSTIFLLKVLISGGFNQMGRMSPMAREQPPEDVWPPAPRG